MQIKAFKVYLEVKQKQGPFSSQVMISPNPEEELLYQVKLQQIFIGLRPFFDFVATVWPMMKHLKTKEDQCEQMWKIK